MPANDIGSDAELAIETKGRLAFITLNRPDSLNALSLEMIRILSSALERWKDDGAVKAIVIQGAGARAFCAGGDIRAAYTNGMRYRRGETTEPVISLFFAEEYRLNRQMFHYGRPMIALMDGITMGGGFGIAAPCRYRIATERTVFAMPEVGIGFFPDVGSIWFLNRCPGQIGAWLALTGISIGPEDMIYSGLATHFAPASELATLVDRLGGAENPATILAGLKAPPPGRATLEENRAAIDRCFTGDTVEDILDALRKEGTPWADHTASVIESRAPISLKVTLAHLRRGKTEDFDAIISRDFIIAQHFLAGHDFYEGVRAAVIDKDRQPRWDPARLSDISTATVERYFVETGYGLDGRAA